MLGAAANCLQQNIEKVTDLQVLTKEALEPALQVLEDLLRPSTDQPLRQPASDEAPMSFDEAQRDWPSKVSKLRT